MQAQSLQAKGTDATKHASQRSFPAMAAAALLATALVVTTGCSSGTPNSRAVTVSDSSAITAGDRVTEPQQARISDPVIERDLGVIGAYRARMEQLNNGGTEVSRYQMRKALRWTDFAYDEYTDNDRSNVVNAALSEADKIITGLERDPTGDSLSKDTPIIDTSMLIRDDLWRRVKTYKQDENFACVEHHVADAEVYLVWAGHEYREMGWRHAVPQVHMAERAIRGVEEGLQDARENNGCFKTVVREVTVEKPVLAPVVVSDADIATMPRYVHFAVNEYALTGKSRDLLDEVVAVMNNHPEVSLQVEGHTDPRGNARYNAKLSERRYQAVIDYLVAEGISRSRLQGYAAGELEPLHMGCSPEDHAMNRRATFVVTRGGEKVSVYDPIDDLKIKASQPNDCGDGRR